MRIFLSIAAALLLVGCVNSGLRMTTATPVYLSPVPPSDGIQIAGDEDIVVERFGRPISSVTVADSITVNLGGSVVANIPAGAEYYEVRIQDTPGKEYCSVEDTVNGKEVLGPTWTAKSCIYDEDIDGVIDFVSYMVDDNLEIDLGMFIVDFKRPAPGRVQYSETQFSGEPVSQGVMFFSKTDTSGYLREFTRSNAEVLTVWGPASPSGGASDGLFRQGSAIEIDQTYFGSSLMFAGTEIEIIEISNGVLSFQLSDVSLSETLFMIPRRTLCDDAIAEQAICQGNVREIED